MDLVGQAEVAALRDQLTANLTSGSKTSILGLPKARRAHPKLTFWGKGIQGFWSIEGKPGVWVWRKRAKTKSGVVVAQPDMVAARPVHTEWAYKGAGPDGLPVLEIRKELEGGDEEIGVFSREFELEKFFSLKGVGE